MKCLDRLDAYVDGAEDSLKRYFAVDGDKPQFTGSQFDRLFAGDDWQTAPNAFECCDLVAVKTLDVEVPAHASLQLLGNYGDARSRLAELLSSIELRATLESADGRDLLYDDESAIWRSWRLLREFEGVGDATAAKLLARKRPHLVPISDSVVRGVAGRGTSWWRCVARYFESEERVDRLRGARDAAAPSALPLARVLDIAVWMQAR